MVLHCGMRWTEIVRMLGKHQGSVPSGDLLALVYEWDPDTGHDDVRDVCILPLRARDAAELAFMSRLRDIMRDLDERTERALEPERYQQQQDRDMGIVRVTSVEEPSFHYTQKLLQASRFKSPLFAVVSPKQPPRLTIGATVDCQCRVPWNEKPQWERLPFVRYQLPPATSPWQSQWDGSQQHWVALDCDGLGVVSEELATLGQHAEDSDLLDYCICAQRLLSGSRVANLHFPSNSMPLSEATAAASLAAAKAFGEYQEETEATASARIKREAEPHEPLLAARLGTAAQAKGDSVRAGRANMDEDVLSWTSGRNSDASESGTTDEAASEAGEESKSMAGEFGEGDKTQVSESQDGSQSQSADGDDSGGCEDLLLDEGCPATPPRREREDKATPEKRPFWERDVDPGFSSDDSSAVRPRNKSSLSGSYCDEFVSC